MVSTPLRNLTIASSGGVATVEGVARMNMILTNVGTTPTLLCGASADNGAFDIRHFVSWGLIELGRVMSGGATKVTMRPLARFAG